MKNYKHRHLTEKIIKGYYEVYNELGTGFLESVYENALAIALTETGLDIKTQYSVPVYFRNTEVGKFRADIVADNKVILELKAVNRLQQVHEAQLMELFKSNPY